MKWLDELPKKKAEQVMRIMLWREGIMKRLDAGLMDKETAQIGVSVCNSMIEKIWRSRFGAEAKAAVL